MPVVAPWYGGCIGLVHDCCTVVVLLYVIVVVGLANVEMVLPNLSWPQRGYGNIALTNRGTGGCDGLCCGVVLVGMIAVVLVE